MISTDSDRPMAKSHSHSTPDLLLDNFEALETRPGRRAIVSPIPSPEKRIHDIANHGAEFVPEPMSPGGPSRHIAPPRIFAR
ncbi:hypothetical protein H8B02_09310 [Bradyrhizobium sp. Pear77]|uniref:hypothetical protein n=1 Tax=Bradyrhizobium altum TaxID=1571202 RepID=UPI001E4B5EB5|nr:hypothetical protein [Bradyrhizobium altum]MCC8953641.1 hypothetical protein [Bradyrhizobium altum]